MRQLNSSSVCAITNDKSKRKFCGHNIKQKMKLVFHPVCPKWRDERWTLKHLFYYMNNAFIYFSKKDSNSIENKVKQVHAFSFYICLLFSPKVTKPRVMWVQSFFSILNEQQIIFINMSFYLLLFCFCLSSHLWGTYSMLEQSILVFFHSCSFAVVGVEENYNCAFVG